MHIQSLLMERMEPVKCWYPLNELPKYNFVPLWHHHGVIVIQYHNLMYPGPPQFKDYIRAARRGVPCSLGNVPGMGLWVPPDPGGREGEPHGGSLSGFQTCSGDLLRGSFTDGGPDWALGRHLAKTIRLCQNNEWISLNLSHSNQRGVEGVTSFMAS